ncbi:MAG: hypothetical protein QOE11_1268 [Solirubrobacteraceae bacterium]|jgi:hypothetical protein|nr:hypothetical protein [Solirubrobacteraceae bacterium]
MTRPDPRATLVLACAALCTVALTACGGSDRKSAAKATDSGPQATLVKTFRSSSTSVRRARVVASVRLDPEGLLKLGGPIAIRLTGPFAAPTRDAPPRFDLALLATLGGQKFKGAAISTGAKTFLRLDDRTYALGTGGHKATGDSHPLLQALGVDPLRWITSPRDAGAARVAGVDTKRISGDVDAQRLLADVGALLDKAGGSAASLLSPKLLRQIGDAVKSAKVSVWTGSGDSILRQLAVDVRFAFKSAQSPIVGLDGGRLRLKLRLDDVNGAPVDVAPPAGVRPLAEVTGKGGLGAVLGGLRAGLTGGIGGGAIDLVSCVTAAGGSSVDLVSCVSKIGS